MASLKETFVALARLNDLADDEEKHGILLCSFPEKFSFHAIMTDTQKTSTTIRFVKS